MKQKFKFIFYIAAVLYPVIVFTFLVILKLPVRVLSLFIVALALAFFLSATSNISKNKKERMSLDWKPIMQASIFLAIGIFCFFTNETIFLKLYSVVISVTFLVVFGSTLFYSPNIIFRFAQLQDKSIKGSASEKLIEKYCKKVTIAWCIFFVFNGSVSAVTTFFCSDEIWSLYNGGISYLLMGCMFATEYIIRKKVDKKMLKRFAISTFKYNSRPLDFIVCYEDVWSKKIYKTWYDFLVDSAKMRKIISEYKGEKWILHCEDYWYFLCTFVALLQCNKTILLTQNVTSEFIAEIKSDGIEFITDKVIPNSINILTEISNVSVVSDDEIKNTPNINDSETNIILYTSGSTGKPKGVLQRMKEFEMDNAFVATKWQEEFYKRKLVTTVSQHHIYGFLFSISLPFSYGIPFRRKRIEFPEEFEKLTDEKYVIVATPAFLKRTVETESKLPLRDCFIFTSGGALSESLAIKTKNIFGVCPLEVYGSTETSGIAYRQQTKDGLIWTPFDNAKIWKGDDGCLVIISPYIKDKNGFATADLVDIFPDGRFILKGRLDSIVKIEEKRISMTEVENRILQSGLVKDVKVIALENTRQYLACAIVLNEKGKFKFLNEKKLVINKFFHEYLMSFFENVVIPKRYRYLDSLPCDVQGKVHKDSIVSLFKNKEV